MDLGSQLEEQLRVKTGPIIHSENGIDQHIENREEAEELRNQRQASQQVSPQHGYRKTEAGRLQG